MRIKIIGTGSAVPENIVTNQMLSEIMDTSDEWIYTRTGIRQRRIAVTETTSGLASQAARKALEDSGCSPEEIDLIIVATFSPKRFQRQWTGRIAPPACSLETGREPRWCRPGKEPPWRLFSIPMGQRERC